MVSLCTVCSVCVCVCAVFVGRCVLWLWGCCNCFDEISNSFSPAYHLKAQIFSIFAGGMKRWHNFYLIVCQQLFCCLNCFFLQRCLILFIHLFWHAVLSEQTCSFCFTSPVFVLKKRPPRKPRRGQQREPTPMCSPCLSRPRSRNSKRWMLLKPLSISRISVWQRTAEKYRNGCINMRVGSPRFRHFCI